MKPDYKPDYKQHDPRGWCGDPRRGAALGRGNFHGQPKDRPVKLYLSRVRMSGGYDPNGTYFGESAVPGQHLWWYCYPDNGGQDVDGTVRACTREAAKAQIRQSYPLARFYR